MKKFLLIVMSLSKALQFLKPNTFIDKMFLKGCKFLYSVLYYNTRV